MRVDREHLEPDGGKLARKRSVARADLEHTDRRSGQVRADEGQELGGHCGPRSTSFNLRVESKFNPGSTLAATTGTAPPANDSPHDDYRLHPQRRVRPPRASPGAGAGARSPERGLAAPAHVLRRVAVPAHTADRRQRPIA